MRGPHPEQKHERIWDPLVRLFHWSLVAAFATAWMGRGEAVIHESAGKAVLVLIVFRIIWGVLGTGAARFETFLHGPRTTFSYAIAILRGRPAHYAGHNPAGAAMILLMMLALTITTASGILMTTTKLWGNGTIEYIHGQSANLMLILIVGHLLGVIAASFQHKENLIFSMISGWKTVATETRPYLGQPLWTARRLVMALLIVTAATALWQGSTFALNASFWRMEKIIATSAKQSGCEMMRAEGPVIIAYPQVELQYAARIVGKSEPIKISVAGWQAIDKNPELNFPSLMTACEEVKAQARATRVALSAFRSAELTEASGTTNQVATISPDKILVVAAQDGSRQTPDPPPVLQEITKISPVLPRIRKATQKQRAKQKRKRKGRKTAFSSKSRWHFNGTAQQTNINGSAGEWRLSNSGKGSSNSGSNSGHGRGED
jgi:cytochrome b